MTNWRSAFRLNPLTYSILVLLALALWQAFSPYILQWKNIQQVRAQHLEMSPDELSKIINNKEHKPTLLFLYASWCANCNSVGKNLIELSSNHKLHGINIVALSVDEALPEMERHFVTQGYIGYFTPYILAQKPSRMTLKDVFVSAGGKIANGLPYTAVFNGKGKILQEEVGEIKMDTLQIMIAALRDDAISADEQKLQQSTPVPSMR